MEETVTEIIDKLREQNHTISFAESCTGGLLAASFIAIAGASDVLNGSLVTYSNEIKHKWLGVEKEILETHGAVSKECVEQMLIGVKKMAQSDYAIAISGIAGPGGATPTKPVGTVYIGVSTPHTTTVFHCHFDGDRKAVQKATVDFAINTLVKELDCSTKQP